VAVPTIAQQVTGNPGNVTNFSTSAVTTTAGNTLLLLVGRGSGTTGNVTAVTDPVGNTWTVATRGGQGGSGNTHCEVWSTTQNVGPLTAQAISVTTSSAQLTVYNVVEIRDLDRSALVEAVSPDPSGAAASTTHSTPTVATARQKDWILSVINHAHNAAADTFTSVGGVQLTSVVSGTDFRMSAGYYPTTATGSFDGDWTLPASLAAGLITVAFRQARPVAVLVDWNKDGDYNDTSEDVTSLVHREVGLSFEYGRDQVTALAPMVSGRGSITLDNTDERFSPRNTGSPIYGSVKPARPTLATRTVGANTYTLFIGHTDDSPINPDPLAQTVSLSLVDSLADFRGLNISTPLYAGIRTGQAIGYILDACGWSASLRDLDAGATIISWWWEDGTDALTALDNVLKSEGPPALLTVGSSGEIVFKDRHHRLLDAASLTSQSTWRATGTEPVMLRQFSYDEAWRNIVNFGRFNVDVRQPGPLEVVWSSDTPISLSSGEQKVITVSTSDPFYNAVTPVLGTDYTVAGSVAVTLTRTSGASAGIVLTSSGVSVVSALQLRAVLVPVTHALQVSATDPTSVTDYGQRAFPGDLPWCNAYDAEAVVAAAVAQRSSPLPIIQASFVIPGSNPTKADAILARDLSDRVTIVEPTTSLNDPFYIETISHQLTGEHDHTVTFGVEMAATPPSPIFRLDTAGQGADDGKLGGGFDDPANILILGSAVSGHRLDEGVLAL
jgi:hypothetical protein